MLLLLVLACSCLYQFSKALSKGETAVCPDWCGAFSLALINAYSVVSSLAAGVIRSVSSSLSSSVASVGKQARNLYTTSEGAKDMIRLLRIACSSRATTDVVACQDRMPLSREEVVTMEKALLGAVGSRRTG